MRVAIFFGSKSDSEKMKGAVKCLKEFGIEYRAHILSAHRVPEVLENTIRDLEEEGFEAFIAGAGLAAHLPGVIASKTVLPVIGVPLNAALGGQDSLYSIVQMPKGIPVGTVGIDNSFNAAMLSVQILAIKYPEIKERLVSWRREMKEKFVRENTEVTLDV